IGHAAGGVIDETRAHRFRRPAEDAVEPKQREARRKCRMPGSARKLARQCMPQRGRPEPFVEIAEHHSGHGVRAGDRDKAMGLASALAELQAEMRGDQSERARGGCNLELDRATWLALAMRDVVYVRRPHGPATEDQLAIVAVGCDDR